MGNHEWCGGCGQSDFHRGRTCQEAYPKEYRAYQKKKAQLRREQMHARAVMKRLARKIKQQFKVKVELDDSYIRIHFWDALEAAEAAKKSGVAGRVHNGRA